MRSVRRRLPVLLLLYGLSVQGACATIRPASPASSACEDPIYLRLRATEPDSLSEREYERLRDLEAICTAERPAAPQQRDHHRGGSWMLWMPGMMLVGGLMWLMMAAW